MLANTYAAPVLESLNGAPTAAIESYPLHHYD